MSRSEVRALGAALGAAVFVFADLAGAQAPPLEFPVVNFRPAASTRAYWVTEEAKLRPHLSPSAQLLFNYSSRPLQLVDTNDDSIQSDLIGSRANFDLLLAIGFFDRLELGLALPITAAQSGEDERILDRPAGEGLGGGFGDLRIIPKVMVTTSEDEVTTLSFAVPLTVPMGGNENLLGDSGVTVYPTAIVSFDTEMVDVGFNAGFRYRPEQNVAFTESQRNVAIGSEVFASFGPKIHVWPDHMDVVGDLWFSAPLEEQNAEEVPVESLGGLRFYLANGLVFNAGAGGGLTRGIGAPKFRIVAGIGYEYKEDPDPDKDGILYDADKCPLRPEDKDGFEDANGCPDPDNDQDGVLDVKDKCPLVPEDKDNFEDEDGCPDTDNDKDKILDVDDKCRNDPEDYDQFEDADGCPDPDNDQDGILDPQDKCPLEPEDKDTFEDEDGCPDPDNDQDGILDKDDKCPLEPEDKDNFADVDGCPDPDNDGDGILDPQDKCPLEPEVFNGFEDDDGCPDKKKGPVQVEHGKITAPPVYFATNDDVILERSFPTLKLVAETFKENPWIKKVRVEGHTDDRGTDQHNQDLSQRRATSVMNFLIQAGVDPSRLEAKGFGEAQPIASNKTRAGRAKNRRVEFIITDPPLKQADTRGQVAEPPPKD